MDERKRLKLQLCLIGAESVGKSSFIHVLETGSIKEAYEPTIGVDFFCYISDCAGKTIKFQLWDSSGQEKFNPVVHPYCKNSNGILAFYDITNKESFEILKQKLISIKDVINVNECSILIIGNKSDLDDQRQVSTEEAESFANENEYLFIEISAKNSSNIKEALNKISDDIISKIDFRKLDLYPTTSRSFTLSLPKLTNENLLAKNSFRSPRIDAMSNSLLISNVSVYNRQNENETRNFIADLIDQVKMLKADVDKKDKLIIKLSSMSKETARSKHEDSAEMETTLAVERKSFETFKKNVEVKYDTILNQFAEEKSKNLLKEEKIAELKSQIEMLKEEITNLSALNDSKLIKINELERDLISYESVSTKSSITINALQNDNKELQSKILKLESSIRQTQDEKQEIEKKVNSYSEKVKKISASFSVGTSQDENAETFISKFEEIKNESQINKIKYTEILEKCNFTEAENAINKQTIQSLKNDIRNYENELFQLKITLENVKTERDAAISSKEKYEKDFEFLKEKLINTQQVWLTTTKELDVKDEKCSVVEKQIKALEKDTSNYKLNFDVFKEEIAKLLSDDYFKIQSSESEIKEKIKLVMISSKHRGLMIATLENEILSLKTQIQKEINEKLELKLHIESSHKKIIEQNDKILDLEAKLSDNKITIDNLTNERAKVMMFMEKLSSAYNLPTNLIINVPSIDKSLDIIFLKIEQIKKSKIETKSSSEISVATLETKLNMLKEQLENKDIHLELLRKKLTELEEEKSGRSEIKTQFDNYIKSNRKLTVQVQRLNEQVAILKNENTILKSQLLDIDNLKFENMNKESEINKLKLRINELENTNNQHLVKIGELRENVESTDQELNKTLRSSDGSIKALGSELRNLKMDYEKCRMRERQLLDFRDAVAKRVGLEVNSLSLADYDIISRIECYVNGHIHLVTHLPQHINHIAPI